MGSRPISKYGPIAWIQAILLLFFISWLPAAETAQSLLDQAKTQQQSAAAEKLIAAAEKLSEKMESEVEQAGICRQAALLRLTKVHNSPDYSIIEFLLWKTLINDISLGVSAGPDADVKSFIETLLDIRGELGTDILLRMASSLRDACQRLNLKSAEAKIIMRTLEQDDLPLLGEPYLDKMARLKRRRGLITEARPLLEGDAKSLAKLAGMELKLLESESIELRIQALNRILSENPGALADEKLRQAEWELYRQTCDAISRTWEASERAVDWPEAVKILISAYFDARIQRRKADEPPEVGVLLQKEKLCGKEFPEVRAEMAMKIKTLIEARLPVNDENQAERLIHLCLDLFRLGFGSPERLVFIDEMIRRFPDIGAYSSPSLTQKSRAKVVININEILAEFWTRWALDIESGSHRAPLLIKAAESWKQCAKETGNWAASVNAEITYKQVGQPLVQPLLPIPDPNSKTAIGPSPNQELLLAALFRELGRNPSSGLSDLLTILYLPDQQEFGVQDWNSCLDRAARAWHLGLEECQTLGRLAERTPQNAPRAIELIARLGGVNTRPVLQETLNKSAKTEHFARIWAVIRPFFNDMPAELQPLVMDHISDQDLEIFFKISNPGLPNEKLALMARAVFNPERTRQELRRAAITWMEFHPSSVDADTLMDLWNSYATERNSKNLNDGQFICAAIVRTMAKMEDARVPWWINTLASGLNQNSIIRGAALNAMNLRRQSINDTEIWATVKNAEMSTKVRANALLLLASSRDLTQIERVALDEFATSADDPHDEFHLAVRCVRLVITNNKEDSEWIMRFGRLDSHRFKRDLVYTLCRTRLPNAIAPALELVRRDSFLDPEDCRYFDPCRKNREEDRRQRQLEYARNFSLLQLDPSSRKKAEALVQMPIPDPTLPGY